MDSLLIKSKKPFSLNEIAALLCARWSIEAPLAGELIVNGKDSRVYLHVDDRVIGLACEHCLILDYSDVDLVKAVVELTADDEELLVDNDFDQPMRGDDFVARIKHQQGWNWRTQRA